MNKKAFGLRLKEARIRGHLTTDGLSEVCQCSPVSIRQIESGSRLPSLPKLVDFCNILKRDPAYFLSADLRFDVEKAAEQDCDRRLDEMIAKVRQLPPSQIETVCSTIETLVTHMK